MLVMCWFKLMLMMLVAPKCNFSFRETVRHLGTIH